MTHLRKKAALLAAAGAAALGFGIQGANAATILDVRVISATGQIGTGDTKNVTIGETGSVTVGIYLVGLSTVNSYGLGSYAVSFRSFGETYNVPASPTALNGTPTVTVLSATACDEATLPAGFDGPSAKALADITGGLPAVDPDTDIDAWKIGKAQTPAGNTYSIGFGLSDDTLLATATFTALDLADTTYLFDRKAQLNTYFYSGGSNGGAVIQGLTGSDPVTNGLTANLITSASQIGSAVNVTVSVPSAPEIPLPPSALMGLAGLGLVGWVSRKRRA